MCILSYLLCVFYPYLLCGFVLWDHEIEKLIGIGYEKKFKDCEATL